MHKRSEGLLKQLQRFSKLRNDVAHSSADYEDYAKYAQNEQDEQIASLITYKENKKIPFTLTKKQVVQKMQEVETMSGWLHEMLTEVRMREKRF